jgi:hypothetical protein
MGGREGADRRYSGNQGGTPLVHYLLMYDVVDDYVTRRAPLRAAHIGLAREAAARGELVLGGALNPPEGVVLLFRGDSPAAAEAFARAIPTCKRARQELEGARVDDGGRARRAGEAARCDQLDAMSNRRLEGDAMAEEDSGGRRA